MEGKKYAEAIHAFKQALKAEKYWEGYYSIAQCLRHLNNVDDALVYLAKADLQGSTAAVKAKEELEMIYKKIHGGNLTGINKIYRKAEKLPD